MSDEESFVILGSTPTPSMEHYAEGKTLTMTQLNGTSAADNMMQSSSLNPQLKSLSLSAHTENDNLKNESLAYSFVNKEAQVMNANSTQASIPSGVDFAEKFLLGEIPKDSLKFSIWKNFPSLSASQSKNEIDKLESLMSEHILLKDNLHKTNEAMHQHFSTINTWQNRVQELKENQAASIAAYNAINTKLKAELQIKMDETEKLKEELRLCTNLQEHFQMKSDETDKLKEELRLKIDESEKLHIALIERDEYMQSLKMEIVRLKEERDEKVQQFNINMASAVSENMELIQEVSAKDAIIKNMTNLIEKLEKQLTSFEVVSLQQNPNDLKEDDSQNSFLISTEQEKDFANAIAQLNAAREQNIELLEDVSGKISTIKRLGSECSKLQHQMLSLEMIANENGQQSIENSETIRKLKDELNQMSIDTIETREMKGKYVEQINLLQESIAIEKQLGVNLHSENQMLKAIVEQQKQKLEAISDELSQCKKEIGDQRKQHDDLEKEALILRTKEINSDIRINHKDQKLDEFKEEIGFLMAQLDVFKSDFQLEREARQDIANEKEELLSDLKLLQRRNQQLIDAARSRLSNERNTENASFPANASAPLLPAAPERVRPVAKFVCPVCNYACQSLTSLQEHVQSCLDN